MNKNARTWSAVVFGGIAFPALIYWGFGDYIAWWVFIVLSLGGYSAAYAGLTEAAANERIADGD
ncbi:hypothetical protein LV476_00345 [Guyparkeria hydrothermalis]|uniref:hypothetical protein n=1 Tax=Guyparkeria hydrothermalis TaxID=923 RepID=UPI002021E063|nr:hypothetical protein [Guyparkeria hydrothermalis]MCL7743403.1 hypothetical protein [Guyparkeria hydrothermalis]